MMIRIACLLLAVSACAQQSLKLEDLAWIAGAWSGKVGSAQSEEIWTTPAGGAMIGMSRTLARGRMVAFEFLRIEQREGGIYYVAQPQGRPPTNFKLTRSSSTLAVFENPQHDHPKIITYEMTAPGALVATIEGDSGGKHRKTSFSFERVPPSK